jgi:hypothetical protein
MELWRLKNTDTRIVFPICDADGDPTSHADDNTPDSEWLSWNTSGHGGAAPSFADCTHEFVEIAGGFYYLDVSAAEINADFTIIQMKTALAGCKTQAILIRTYVNNNEDLHTDIATAISDIAAVHVHAGIIETDVAAVHTHIADIHDTDLPAIKSETALIVADTAELQTELADGGRTDLLIDSIVAFGAPPTAAVNAAAVLDHAIADHLTAGSVGNLIASLGGKMTVVGNQLIVYAANNSTELFRFNLTDAAADPTMTDVYTRAVTAP